MKFNGFIVHEDCEKALKELKRLKVYELRNDDLEDGFADVWWHVQHEIDLYEDREDTNALTAGTHKSAKKWLEKYRHLYNKYETK